MKGSSESVFSVDVNGQIFELSETEFKGVLYEMVSLLVFEKAVDRVAYVLDVPQSELIGSGGEHFDPLSVSLFRHLRVERCSNPRQTELGEDTGCFRLHAVVDGLAAAAFFLRGGDHVPHMILGRPDRAVLTVVDRGARTLLNCGDPQLLRKLTQLIPGDPVS
jgi:hypothetical protein